MWVFELIKGIYSYSKPNLGTLTQMEFIPTKIESGYIDPPREFKPHIESILFSKKKLFKEHTQQEVHSRCQIQKSTSNTQATFNT